MWRIKSSIGVVEILTSCHGCVESGLSLCEKHLAPSDRLPGGSCTSSCTNQIQCVKPQLPQPPGLHKPTQQTTQQRRFFLHFPAKRRQQQQQQAPITHFTSLGGLMQDPIVLPVGWWLRRACAPPPAHHPQTQPPTISTSKAQIQVLLRTFTDRRVSEREKQIHVSGLRRSIFYVCETSVYART